MLFSVLTKAQEDRCAEKLTLAQQLFESGQIEQIPLLLDSCLRNGFSKSQKNQAYRLLIQAYLFDSNREMADSVMFRFLTQHPDYKIESSDPVEFVELYNTFKVSPIWSFGISVGSNISQIYTTENFSTSNINKLDSKNSTDGVGFNVSLHANKFLKKKLWLSLNLNYISSKFTNTELLNYHTEEVVYKESNSLISLPVTINRNFFNSKITPFIFAGIEPSYLLRATSSIKRKSLTDNALPATSINSLDRIKARNNFNLFATAGIGAILKTEYGLFQFSVGYRFGLLPYVKESERYADTDLIYYYQHIDNNFRINTINFSLGYSYLLYKIKKRQINEASN